MKEKAVAENTGTVPEKRAVSNDSNSPTNSPFIGQWAPLKRGHQRSTPKLGRYYH